MMRPQNRHRAGSDDTSNPSIQFIPSVLSLEHQPLCANHKLLFAASSSLPCQHGIDRCLLLGGRLTDSIAVPSLAPDPTVTLIAQDDLHLWLQTPLAWIISSPCSSGTRIAPNRRATFLCCRCCKRSSCNSRAACAASALLAALLGRRLSCLACYPHRRPRRPPPAKCRGNEVGAKMTGSISDFWSGTYASVAVPRELAFGASSRGSVCAWGDDYIILVAHAARRERPGHRRPCWTMHG